LLPPPTGFKLVIGNINMWIHEVSDNLQICCSMLEFHEIDEGIPLEMITAYIIVLGFLDGTKSFRLVRINAVHFLALCTSFIGKWCINRLCCEQP
jgi:hypothetical protein